MATPTVFDIIYTLSELEEIREDMYSAGWMMAQFICKIPMDSLEDVFECIERYGEAEKRLIRLEETLSEILGPMGGDEE